MVAMMIVTPTEPRVTRDYPEPPLLPTPRSHRQQPAVRYHHPRRANPAQL